MTLRRRAQAPKGVAALIKPYSLAMLIVPFLMRSLSSRAFIAGAPLAVDALVSRWLWPGLIEDRGEAVWRAVGESMRLGNSLTGGVSRVLVKLGLAGPEAALALGAVAHLGFVAILILTLRNKVAEERRGLAWATVAVCCALPRMAAYDAFIFGPAVLVALWPIRGRAANLGPAASAILALALFKEAFVVLPVVLSVYLVLENRAVSGPSVHDPGGKDWLWKRGSRRPVKAYSSSVRIGKSSS